MIQVWLYPPPSSEAGIPDETPQDRAPWVVVAKIDGSFDCEVFLDERSARRATRYALFRAELASRRAD
jgi:hypothetical protein